MIPAIRLFSCRVKEANTRKKENLTRSTGRLSGLIGLVVPQLFLKKNGYSVNEFEQFEMENTQYNNYSYYV
jgi:hypothetical protein